MSSSPSLPPSPTFPEHSLRRGVLTTLAAVSMFAMVDAMSKYLARDYPVIMILWVRYFLHSALMIAAFSPRLGMRLFYTRHPWLQGSRGLLLLTSSIFFTTAIKYMPLAEATSIAFCAPLVVTILAAKFLREKVDAAHWIAISVGFIGVLVIIRPGSHVFAWASLLPLCNATAFACYQIITRKLAGHENVYTSTLYAGLIGFILCSVAAPFFWVAPQSFLHFAIFLCCGLVGGVAHLTMVKAFEHAPASRLAPFSYGQLLLVVFNGWLFFDDFPDLWSLSGIGAVIACGLFVATRRQGHKSEQ